MKSYPISVPPYSYRGSNAAKLEKQREYNRDAEILEKHINKVLEDKAGTDWDYFKFSYGTIAHELNMYEDRVCEILFAVDCGSNGFTVYNKDKKLSDQE